MIMRILCVGANHRSANVAVREKLVFGGDRLLEALHDLRGRWSDAEFVILSTCNRTEIYAARPVHGHPRTEQLRDWVGEFHSLAKPQYVEALYDLADGEAAGHLFAVTAGMDSLVPGEDQIVSQAKTAYSRAVEAGSAGAVMSELFQNAFHVTKHIRTETEIASGKVSVASVAVQFVQQVFEALDGKCVLNIGAGEMNKLMLQHLQRLGAGRIIVVNRNRDRAERLAEACGGSTGDFGRLGDHVAEADIILTSTGSRKAIISAEMIQAAQAKRLFQPLLVVDIAVPRDVEPEAGRIDDVFLYNIDDLDRIVQNTLASRRKQLAAAEGIIAEHVEELLAALNVRNVAPTIEALYRKTARIAAKELAAAQNKLSQHDDAEEDMAILQRVVHRTVRQILHPCTDRLRRSAGSDAARAHIAAIRELFDLDGEEAEDD